MPKFVAAIRDRGNAEPYSDTNAAQSFEMTQAAEPVTPSAGEAVIWTPDAASLYIKNPAGTVTKVGPSAGGAGGPFTLSQVEVNLGAAARRGRFTISDVGIEVGSRLVVLQSGGPYTGKGTRADEAEMDYLEARGTVTGAGSATVYWSSRTFVKGNVKFNYRSG